LKFIGEEIFDNKINLTIESKHFDNNPCIKTDVINLNALKYNLNKHCKSEESERVKKLRNENKKLQSQKNESDEKFRKCDGEFKNFTSSKNEQENKIGVLKNFIFDIIESKLSADQIFEECKKSPKTGVTDLYKKCEKDLEVAVRNSSTYKFDFENVNKNYSDLCQKHDELEKKYGEISGQVRETSELNF
jgi:hypothetical protein